MEGLPHPLAQQHPDCCWRQRLLSQRGTARETSRASRPIRALGHSHTERRNHHGSGGRQGWGHTPVQPLLRHLPVLQSVSRDRGLHRTCLISEVSVRIQWGCHTSAWHCVGQGKVLNKCPTDDRARKTIWLPPEWQLLASTNRVEAPSSPTRGRAAGEAGGPVASPQPSGSGLLPSAPPDMGTLPVLLKHRNLS